MSKEAPLIDPSLLAGLTPEQKEEALAAAAAAARAEQRAEQRALARALERKRLQREQEREEEQRELLKRNERSLMMNPSGGGGGGNGNKVVFLSKKKREEMKQKQSQERPKGEQPSASDTGNGGSNHRIGSNGYSNGYANSSGRLSKSGADSKSKSSSKYSKEYQLSKEELNAIKKTYLGETALDDEETAQRKQIAERKRARQKKKITFKFEWDASEDTSAEAGDYMPTMAMSMTKKKARRSRLDRASGRGGQQVDTNVLTKPLDKMTPRDWRIFRENYDITVRGGKAPPPLRTFQEASSPDAPPIHPVLLDAIENVLKYKTPSPIQRQAIPIGLQRRDLIGIAETGSGKTAAFGIPLCHLILSLPSSILGTVAENGPLALVMAPTRELAIQIDVEMKKILSRQSNIHTSCIVGGQSIQAQAMELRNGVHVVVGTPGRINDCLESAYLVLNQCSYIVLDEADRMIDLGFAPQIESILDAMGGLLKSENEKEAYEQEMEDLRGITDHVPRHRLTAMFSATMPAEVQRIARKYLRHPAIVNIGGNEGGGNRNRRIHQSVLFLSSPGMKEKAMRDVLLNKTNASDKVIVFVNEKKHTEGVSRMIERMGRRTVVLHGGKTQDQREENLDSFRRGGVVLVATDVAGRGLDIPNVKHVINYDVPSRSIDSYCHRIGRTARAGTEGFATSFITDEDEGIMAALKSYLESVGANVPDRLARHPAATSGVGSNLIH